MPDIEKVKAGLQCCTTHHKGENRRCPVCPYRDPTKDCTSAMNQDALDIIETLSAALEAMTGDDCEECKIDTEQEGGTDD